MAVMKAIDNATVTGRDSKGHSRRAGSPGLPYPYSGPTGHEWSGERMVGREALRWGAVEV